MTNDDPPPLFIGRPTSSADLASALRLVADSIAQQRQLAAHAFLTHPTTLVVVVPVVACMLFLAELPDPAVWIPFISSISSSSSSSSMSSSRGTVTPDMGTRLVVVSAVCMLALLVARSLTGGYIGLAEQFRVRSHTGPDDVVVGARLGKQWVGVIVVRMEREEKTGGGARDDGHQEGRGLVRAWTTKMRYRRRGLGGDLVRHAWIETRRRFAEDGTPRVRLIFDDNHANSRLLMADMYNAGFKSRELEARRLFDRTVAEMESKEGTRLG